MGTVLILAGILGLAGYGMVSQLGSRAEPVPVGGVVDLALEGVSRLKIDGLWQIEVVSAAAAGRSVGLELPERGVRSERDGDTLELENRGGGRRSARIILSQLRSIEIDGASDISLAGFSSDTLEIDIDGAGSLSARDLRVDRLDLSSDGAVRIDLRESLVTNAALDVDGAASLQLQMAGGILEGELDGAAVLSFSGPVSAERIDTGGLGSVQRVGE